jgi:hypothetical protein
VLPPRTRSKPRWRFLSAVYSPSLLEVSFPSLWGSVIAGSRSLWRIVSGAGFLHAKRQVPGGRNRFVPQLWSPGQGIGGSAYRDPDRGAQLKARAELLTSTELSVRRFVALTLGDIIAGSEARITAVLGDVVLLEVPAAQLPEKLSEKLAQEIESNFPGFPVKVEVVRL